MKNDRKNDRKLIQLHRVTVAVFTQYSCDKILFLKFCFCNRRNINFTFTLICNNTVVQSATEQSLQHEMLVSVLK